MGTCLENIMIPLPSPLDRFFIQLQHSKADVVREGHHQYPLELETGFFVSQGAFSRCMLNSASPDASPLNVERWCAREDSCAAPNPSDMSADFPPQHRLRMGLDRGVCRDLCQHLRTLFSVKVARAVRPDQPVPSMMINFGPQCHMLHSPQHSYPKLAVRQVHLLELLR